MVYFTIYISYLIDSPTKDIHVFDLTKRFPSCVWDLSEIEFHGIHRLVRNMRFIVTNEYTLIDIIKIVNKSTFCFIDYIGIDKNGDQSIIYLSPNTLTSPNMNPVDKNYYYQRIKHFNGIYKKLNRMPQYTDNRSILKKYISKFRTLF